MRPDNTLLRAVRLVRQASQAPAILAGFERPLRVLWRLAVGGDRPGVVRLRRGPRFEVRGALDLWLLKEICLDREYERFATPLGETATVVDIGAGIGELAIHLAAGQPARRVIAVEPAPDTFAVLERNLARNGIANVTAVRAAIGAGPATLALDLATAPALRSATPTPTPGLAPVPAMTLGELFGRHSVDRCDLLKIDCEGGEEEILRDPPVELLERVGRLVVETHREGAGERLAAMLAGRGLATRVSPNRFHRHLALVYAEHSA
ncbi:MAG: FkbM family methyltransferase [Thermoanaerobaculales bacterium]|jgi:FkbM family methyltransferase|nr:FkbM family methyltransferase [Thermoanaerobaculales bacterium]